MRRAFLKVRAFYSRLLLVLALVAGACTFAIMWVIDVNAFQRKVFNAPVPAALEITQSLLVLSIMLPFAYTLLKRDHVNTVFLTSHLSSSTRRWLHLVWMIVGFLLFAAVTYGTFQYGMRSYRMNEQIWGATIQFPLWPAKLSVSVATFFLCLQFLMDAIGTMLFEDYHEDAGEAQGGHAHV